MHTTQRDTELLHDLNLFEVQDYEHLRYSNDRAVKDAFIAGDIDEPDLVYADAALTEFDDSIAQVREFARVVAVHPDAIVRRAYEPKVSEVFAKRHLLHAVMAGDDHMVSEYATELYGKPQERYYRYVISDLSERLDRAEYVFGSIDRVRHAVAYLRPFVLSQGDGTPDIDHSILPGITDVDRGMPLRASEIQQVFAEAFAQHGLEGWHALVDAPGERVTFNTNQALRTVFIPSDADLALRKYPLTETHVRAIVAHEIGVHAVRRENGLKSPLGLLGSGLAGYLRGEEGIATYFEQRIDGARHFAGGLGYLAVSWVHGLDGTPRSFRGLFEVMVPYLFISGLEHAATYHEDIDFEALQSRVVRNAWARCVRTFRGTSGRTPGCCFTKDIVYLEGNVTIWKLVTKDPSWEEKFALGKYDPTNEEHIAILRGLGML